jgi:hypothetical protein
MCFYGSVHRSRERFIELDHDHGWLKSLIHESLHPESLVVEMIHIMCLEELECILQGSLCSSQRHERKLCWTASETRGISLCTIVDLPMHSGTFNTLEFSNDLHVLEESGNSHLLARLYTRERVEAAEKNLFETRTLQAG